MKSRDAGDKRTSADELQKGLLTQLIMSLALQRPHEGIMKVALIAAAAAQITITGMSAAPVSREFHILGSYGAG